jgi:hypothetical protein
MSDTPTTDPPEYLQTTPGTPVEVQTDGTVLIDGTPVEPEPETPDEPEPEVPDQNAPDPPPGPDSLAIDPWQHWTDMAESAVVVPEGLPEPPPDPRGIGVLLEGDRLRLTDLENRITALEDVGKPAVQAVA